MPKKSEVERRERITDMDNMVKLPDTVGTLYYQYPGSIVGNHQISAVKMKEGLTLFLDGRREACIKGDFKAFKVNVLDGRIDYTLVSKPRVKLSHK